MKILTCKFFIPFALFSFLTVSSFSQFDFVKHVISSPESPADVCAADINGDYIVDLLTVSGDNGGSVIWWKNDGSQGFERKLLASGFDNPRSVRAGDIDLDGDVDVIAVAWEGNEISWWENDGAEGFTKHIVNSGWIGPHTVELCDLDRDGDTDILCSQFDMSSTMSEIAWWENDGNQEWTKHVVSSRFQQSPFVYGSDMDNDGDTDLIGCGELNGEICWWENDGNENWTEHLIDGQFPKAHTILARDFDKDGDNDILAHACTSGLQAWYENNGDGTFTKKEMEDLGGAIWLECADFDLDGDNDMVATGMGASNIVCYVNDGKQTLTRQDLPGGLTSGFALNTVDIDSDGDPDIVAIGRASNTLAWWENKLNRTSFLNAPKWLDYNNEDKLMFVSNEEEGSIVRIEGSGKQYCIRNGFPISTGLSFDGHSLWAAAGITIYKLNPVTGVTELSLRTTAQFIQGLATDDNNNIYFSDPYSGIIFKYDPVTGQTISFSVGLDYPQNIKYDPGMSEIIVLDGEYTVTLKFIDPSNGQVTKEMVTSIIPGGDIIPDGLGNHYISSPEEGSVYAATRNFTDPVYLYSENHSSPTGIVYFKDDQTIGLMSPVLNSLEIIPANATGIENAFWNINDIQVFPNPVQASTRIIFDKPTIATSSLSLMTITCELLFSMIIQPGTKQLVLDLVSKGIRPGIYIMEIWGEGIVYREKLVKK